MVICTSTFPRLLQSPLPSRDNQVRWHAETIMVIRFHCFRDYYSLLFLPDTIKFVDMRRQSWLSAFIVFKTIKVFFSFQRQSSPLARREKLWSFAPLPFQDYYSLLCLPEIIKSVGMRRQSWSSVFIVFETITVSFAL